MVQFLVMNWLPISIRKALIAGLFGGALALGWPHEGLALDGVTVDGRAILFYTDDVGIFSATRRMSRDDDPTQPALDTRLTNKGSDVVFEPDMTFRKSVAHPLGTTEFSIRGQGFVYTDHTTYSHGTLRLQAVQGLSEATRVRMRYYYAPHLFLGENEDRRPGSHGHVGESVTSHIWSARLERHVTQDVQISLLGRYGLRRYNETFSHRDTNFWTVGPHLDWRLSHRVMLGLGYHYERGLADGREQIQFKDDVSYENHFITVDLDVELMEHLSLMTAVHFERNNWTSNIVGDEREGAHETIVQGEMIVVRQLTEHLRGFAGFQRSNRKQSFEGEGVKNTNFFIGIDGTF
jgi:hypothetical protein